MIEILNGMHETIHYECPLGLQLYRNVDSEDYPQHWHVGIEIIMPSKGGYEVTVGEEHYFLEPEDIILIHSGVIHALKAPPAGERYILQFDTTLLYHLREMETLLYMMPSVIFFKKGDGLHCFFKERLDKIIREYRENSTFREAAIYAALIEIYVELGRKEVYQKSYPGKVESMKQREYFEAVMGACTYINRHYMENLTLEEVAQIGGFSKYHFTRIFKQYMNMTFYEYLNSKRVKRAEELLYNTKELSITDVAMGAGFSSMSAFNRTFKMFKNCSPSDYRRMKQQNIIQETNGN
ncbi:helix-turn-helix domain-containing protein [Lacrimispora sp. JR3]|uniref:helix-turn-helix domain-containing protein n=1 Tax=Lacrimispora sinapis TaxID=3111456 RepID=UPI0037493EF1